MQDDFFSVGEAMTEETKVEVIGNEAQGGLGYQYISMLIMKRWDNCSMLDSLIVLDME
jgi:hypothetical protein